VDEQVFLAEPAGCTRSFMSFFHVSPYGSEMERAQRHGVSHARQLPPADGYALVAASVPAALPGVIL
jgi:hypothetical protein